MIAPRTFELLALGWDLEDAQLLEFSDFLMRTAVCGSDCTLAANPGIYPELGLAHYWRDGEFRLALNYPAVCEHMHRDPKRPGLAEALGLTSGALAKWWERHPYYRGLDEGQGLVGGPWYAVAVPWAVGAGYRTRWPSPVSRRCGGSPC